MTASTYSEFLLPITAKADVTGATPGADQSGAIEIASRDEELHFPQKHFATHSTSSRSDADNEGGSALATRLEEHAVNMNYYPSTSSTGPNCVGSASMSVARIGSDMAIHEEGLCRPCCFWAKGKCNSGSECNFCHLSHEHRRVGKNKSKAEKRRERSREGFLLDGKQDEFDNKLVPSFTYTGESYEGSVAHMATAAHNHSYGLGQPTAMPCTMPWTSPGLSDPGFSGSCQTGLSYDGSIKKALSNQKRHRLPCQSPTCTCGILECCPFCGRVRDFQGMS